MTLEERIKAIAKRDYPANENCVRVRTASEGKQRLRIRRLMEQLSGLTEEEKMFRVEQWEKNGTH